MRFANQAVALTLATAAVLGGGNTALAASQPEIKSSWPMPSTSTQVIASTLLVAPTRSRYYSELATCEIARKAVEWYLNVSNKCYRYTYQEWYYLILD